METINNIWFTSERIYMQTNEGEIYSRPLEAFPSLKDATESERNTYTIELKGTALRWQSLDEDIHISSFYDKTEPNPNNEIALIFRKFPQLNIAEIARCLGIHKSLLAKYIYGITTPSAERIAQIKKVLASLGNELIAVAS